MNFKLVIVNIEGPRHYTPQGLAFDLRFDAGILHQFAILMSKTQIMIKAVGE